jgi:serine/threonine-protein kinase
MAKQNPQMDAEIAPGTVVDGRYKVIRAIGQGGNGVVYEVEHARTGRRLALKALLDETGFARLEQEARAASLMKNGHTARIIDMEPSGPTGAYMVMELLEGQSLRALLDEAGQLPLELTANMILQCCECLHEAHALGVIHRDLKPENVFLCGSPWPGQYDVKVLDFGVMKIAGDGGAIPKSSLTRTGSTVGTPYYMSLEQLRNSSAVDLRADVYSLGVVLYECLSGRKPFQAETIGDLVYALCSGPPTPLGRLRPDLPADLCELVMRTLSANRDDRPRTMVDLAVALLPHGSPAFALWVRVDGKQPALASRAPLSSLPEGAPPPRPLAASPPTAKVPLEPVPGTNQAWPPPADGGGRRDTPTEMYVKDVHGAPPPPADDEDTHGGDRDTPTRAYEAAALQPGYPAGRAPMLETMKSPGAPMPSESSLDNALTIPQQPGKDGVIKFGAPPPGDAPMGAPPGALLTVPLGAAPLGNVLRGLPPMPPAPQAPRAPVSAPPKPGWQVALDRALITVGRSGEDLGRRYRAAPQNTKIIVLIVSGTAMILLLGMTAVLLLK